MHTFAYLSIVSFLSSQALAQFPPTPEGLTTVKASGQEGASLSYKRTYICETTPGVKAYSGYVHLPSTLTGEAFDISTFYWFFESRKDPANAPLSIYLAGGAGESSLDGVTGEGGPCYINADSNSTTINPWSWNNEVNMIYIDQPVQTGFSYDVLTNVTVDLLYGNVTPMNFTSAIPVNDTLIWGTLPSQNPLSTTLGSERSASVLWTFMQVWIENFPQDDMKTKKLSFWGNSWAGFYIPTAFAYFIRQNQAIDSKPQPESSTSQRVIPLGTMGLTSGCMDPLIEAPHYPEIATNNTHGFVAYNQSVHDAALEAYSMPGGCRDLIVQCRAVAAEGDPTYNGKNDTVNAVCAEAFGFCYEAVQGPFVEYTDRSPFHMGHPSLDPFPYYRSSGYFNQAWVQSALGVPLNFTDISLAVANTFDGGVADAVRSSIVNLEFVLQNGYRVAMVHGDSDYRCNWLGGEAVSLAAQWPHSAPFRNSGYADIITNASYTGGYVRQAGTFSFSRVSNAGHAVQAFQPETVSRIFTRTMFGLDVATGQHSCCSDSSSGASLYHTTGPMVVRNVTGPLPPMPAISCYTWEGSSMCADDQLEALQDGSAVVKDFYVIKPAPPESD